MRLEHSTHKHHCRRPCLGGPERLDSRSESGSGSQRTVKWSINNIPCGTGHRQGFGHGIHLQDSWGRFDAGTVSLDCRLRYFATASPDQLSSGRQHLVRVGTDPSGWEHILAMMFP
jgi:hypothetical protein